MVVCIGIHGFGMVIYDPGAGKANRPSLILKSQMGRDDTDFYIFSDTFYDLFYPRKFFNPECYTSDNCSQTVDYVGFEYPGAE